METSILASAGRMLWRYLDAHKVDADALFVRCGLNPALIHESRTRYPYRLLCKVFVEAAVVTRNACIGLDFARHYSPLDLNALGVTFLSSGTLIDAFQRLLRYEAVVNSNLMFSMTESADRIGLTSEVPDVPDDAVRIVEDARMAVLVDLGRMGLDKSLDPVEVAFTYPEPMSTGNHFGVFRCPLTFSQPASKISFNSADARRPFTASNRELALNSDQILEGMINELKQSDIISRVKRAIIEELPSGTPSEEDIATRVFVSSRTLQRRLADESTNFRTLILEVRRELAEKYIADKTMPLAEISYMLGFSDTSSFSRAFKQWTGRPPIAFRSSLHA
jgi:AraC-like DNA-binding protein